ncbi:MAG: HEAT repeat domain-containing protein [Planctomycetota bacterium]|nr:HEAT repeat domain-containing protein [Planctomycetota bacterium]MDA1142470.1 HEAT repeat domain-containing protein [Planctomycetota bacterium]
MTKPILLTDDQIQSFILDGYIQVEADFAKPVHQNIYDKIEEVFTTEGNVGNNILPRIPEIQDVFDHPRVAGAFTSLLGEDYILNPHRHCHLNAPGSKGQRWHKDNYTATFNIRQPRFRWVMAFYYPQDVTVDMGPTGILPGRHFYKGISDDDSSKTIEEELGLTGKAGTVNIVHFDVFHRALPNLSDRKRYMLKFQFVRMQEPVRPTWDFQKHYWDYEGPEPCHQAALDVWNWLRGDHLAAARAAPEGDELEALLQELREGPEESRFRAAHALGSMSEAPIAEIIDALRAEAREKEDSFLEQCPGNVHGYNPTALHAATALNVVGSGALEQILETLYDDHWLVRLSLADVLGNITDERSVSALTSLLDDKHERVRRAAVMSLGQMGSTAKAAVPHLVPKLQDEDALMRKVSAFSMAQIGESADGAVNGLQKMLDDEDRYNRFYAGLALRRIPDPEGKEVLLESLFKARWCPITGPKNTY